MTPLIGLQPEKEYLFTYRAARARGDLFSITPPNPYRDSRSPLIDRVYGPVLSWSARYGPYRDDPDANEQWTACPLTIAVVDRREMRAPRVMWLPIYPYHGAELSWGYVGSGPGDLALALLMDALGEWPTREHFNKGHSLAHLWHMEFRDAFTVKGGRNNAWTLEGHVVATWIEAQREKYPGDARRIEVDLRIEALAAQLRALEDWENEEANEQAREIDEQIGRLVEESARLYHERRN